MLVEIEALRAAVQGCQAEVHRLQEALRDARCVVARLEKSTEEVHQMEAQRVSDMETKAAILKPILDTLVSYQSEAIAFQQGEGRHASRQTTLPDGEASASSPASCLQDVNMKFERMYHLISSYQQTPSFTQTPMDDLLLDALCHVISISKTMNAVVFAKRLGECGDRRSPNVGIDAAVNTADVEEFHQV